MNCLTVAAILALQAPTPPGWMEVVSKDGKYRFAMPAKPAEVVLSAKTPSGDKPEYSYTAHAKGCRYFWYQTPAPGTIPAAERAEFLARWVRTHVRKDKLISDRAVELDGHAGHEFAQRAAVGLLGGEGKMISRIYLIGDDMITIRVIPNIASIEPQDAEPFFRSFRLATAKRAEADPARP